MMATKEAAMASDRLCKRKDADIQSRDHDWRCAFMISTTVIAEYFLYLYVLENLEAC